jgi:putative acyl-CoA dehydrogenase
MRNVLADLVVEWVAATILAARVARSFDQADSSPSAASFSRIAVAIAKFWINKRLPGYVCEALECHGGSGYVEESIMPRLYRQAPLNGIWEGSGNVICLDVLRTMKREPEAVEALLEEMETARGGDRRLDHALDRLKDLIRDDEALEPHARRITESMAVVLEGALLVKHGPAAVSDAFCASRLGDDRHQTFGTLSRTAAFDDIIKLAHISA